MEDMIKLTLALMIIGFVFTIFAAVFYGLYLAFSASVIFGIIVLLVEPMPLFLGLLGFLGHPEVAKQIVEYFAKFF